MRTIQTGDHKNLTFWEWVAIFGSGAIVIAITEILNVAKVWQDAAFYTVGIFVCVIVAMRPDWGRSFWVALSGLLLLHTVGVFFFIREFPATSREFHGPPLIIFFAIEGLFIAGFLSRTAKKKALQRQP